MNTKNQIQPGSDRNAKRSSSKAVLAVALALSQLWVTVAEGTVRLLDKKFVMMRDIFQNNHFAVNVAAMSWSEWGRFKKLGWDGPSRKEQAQMR